METAVTRSLKAGESEIEEGQKILTPEEVYAGVEQIDGVIRSDFTSIEHVLNDKGVLVGIYFKLKENVAKAKFKCLTGYAYLLRVKAGSKVGSQATVIERYDYNAKGDIDFGMTIAEYENGSWVKK